MAVDFFDNNCREAPRTNIRFGLCDKQGNEEPAYSDSENEQDWLAEVRNESGKTIVFIPLDNCIIIHKPGTNNKESLCDGALLFDQDLVLVELKNIRTGGWIPDAIGQLKNTIQLIRDAHDLRLFRHKKAHVCNRKKQIFHVIDQDVKIRFYQETGGFRLHIEGVI
jgi:hypothetical protein